MDLLGMWFWCGLWFFCGFAFLHRFALSPTITPHNVEGSKSYSNTYHHTNSLQGNRRPFTFILYIQNVLLFLNLMASSCARFLAFASWLILASLALARGGTGRVLISITSQNNGFGNVFSNENHILGHWSPIWPSRQLYFSNIFWQPLQMVVSGHVHASSHFASHLLKIILKVLLMYEQYIGV